MVLTGGKRKANKSLIAWVKFVKKVQKEEKLNYKDAIHRAKQRKDKGEKWMTRGGGQTPNMGEDDDEMNGDMDMDNEDGDMDMDGDDEMNGDMDTEQKGGRRRRRHKTMRRSRRSIARRGGRRTRRRASRRHRH